MQTGSTEEGCTLSLWNTVFTIPTLWIGHTAITGIRALKEMQTQLHQRLFFTIPTNPRSFVIGFEFVWLFAHISIFYRSGKTTELTQPCLQGSSVTYPFSGDSLFYIPINLFGLYVLLSQFRSRDVLQGICLLSFHKLCMLMHIWRYVLGRQLKEPSYKLILPDIRKRLPNLVNAS